MFNILNKLPTIAGYGASSHVKPSSHRYKIPPLTSVCVLLSLGIASGGRTSPNGMLLRMESTINAEKNRTCNQTYSMSVLFKKELALVLVSSHQHKAPTVWLGRVGSGDQLGGPPRFYTIIGGPDAVVEIWGQWNSPMTA